MRPNSRNWKKGETRENRSLAHNPQSSETGTEGTEFPTKEVKELQSSLVERQREGVSLRLEGLRAGCRACRAPPAESTWQPVEDVLVATGGLYSKGNTFGAVNEVRKKDRTCLLLPSTLP